MKNPERDAPDRKSMERTVRQQKATGKKTGTVTEKKVKAGAGKKVELAERRNVKAESERRAQPMPGRKMKAGAGKKEKPLAAEKVQVLVERKMEPTTGRKEKIEKGRNAQELTGRRAKPTTGRKAESGKSSDRKCPAQKKCGGCQYLHLTNEQQLAVKQKKAEELLGTYCKVHKITGMEEPYHYRNKVHAVFAYRHGEVISGTYEEGTHEVVPVQTCLLENQKADEIIATIRGLLKSFKIRTYNEDTGYGLFRHVLIRTAHRTGEIMVVLVLGSPILPSKNNFVKALRKAHPEITTVILNVNDKKTSMVLGEKETVLYGKGYIEDILCGCRFRISAKSFYQINSLQTERLYAKAMELAGLTGKERVIDAYCGIGTIGMVAAQQAGEVIGIELNRDAVRDAVRNAKMNAMKNIRFYANDAGVFMTQMAEEGEHADVVFMDPPRAGSDEAFLSSVVRLSPKRIVYISCNPETQARDLDYLTKQGYQAEGVWPFDLFPFTGHVETCVLLSKIKSTQHIEVEINLDEMDLTKAESKATYEEIKEYVLKNYGMNVTNLYIAQVKRKYGIIERINYNLGEGKTRVPQVTAEKEEAIEDALRHFQMIS